MEVFQIHSTGKQRLSIPNPEQIIVDAKSYSDHLVPDASEALLLGTTSDSVLTEAKRLNILSEFTYRNILLLKRDEIKHFKFNTKVTSDSQSTHEVEYINTSTSKPLQPGQACYLMSRFLVTWKLSKETANRAFPEEFTCDWDCGGGSQKGRCSSCIFGDEMVAEVRHMIESDWLYLSKLSKCASLEIFQQERVLLDSKTEQILEKTKLCSDYVTLSAQRALLSLKSVPVAARRSLPVLVNSHGELLSIPVSYSVAISY